MEHIEIVTYTVYILSMVYLLVWEESKANIIAAGILMVNIFLINVMKDKKHERELMKTK